MPTTSPFLHPTFERYDENERQLQRKLQTKPNQSTLEEEMSDSYGSALASMKGALHRPMEKWDEGALTALNAGRFMEMVDQVAVHYGASHILRKPAPAEPKLPDWRSLDPDAWDKVEEDVLARRTAEAALVPLDQTLSADQDDRNSAFIRVNLSGLVSRGDKDIDEADLQGEVLDAFKIEMAKDAVKRDTLNSMEKTYREGKERWLNQRGSGTRVREWITRQLVSTNTRDSII